MAKLIRDLIPEAMQASGTIPNLAIVTGVDRRFWLLEKLVEESGEARADGGTRPELGDVYECLRSLAEDEGLTMKDLEETADEKAARRGRFQCGYLWLDSDKQTAEQLNARAVYGAEEESA